MRRFLNDLSKYKKLNPLGTVLLLASLLVFSFQNCSSNKAYEVKNSMGKDQPLVVSSSEPSTEPPTTEPPTTLPPAIEPTQPQLKSVDPQKISVSWFHRCAITSSGQVRCWGSNNQGQLGDGTKVNRSIVAPISDSSNYISVSVSGEFSCGLTDSGKIKCWGANEKGQLGNGSNNNSSVPTEILDSSTFIQVVSGSYHACGLTSEGEVKCWGSNQNGQLGIGIYGDKNIPTKVVTNEKFTKISSGDHMICGLTELAQLLCWGFNSNGQIGDGTTAERLSPTVATPDFQFVKIYAGSNGRACGVTASGAAYCWGYNGNGQLGNGTLNEVRSPTVVTGGVSFAKLSASGVFHSCGISNTSKLYCWGGNSNGEVGNSQSQVNQNQLIPALIDGNENYREVATGHETSCAVTQSGKIKCWGYLGFDSYGAGAQIFYVPTEINDSGINY